MADKSYVIDMFCAHCNLAFTARIVEEWEPSAIKPSASYYAWDSNYCPTCELEGGEV